MGKVISSLNTLQMSERETLSHVGKAPANMEKSLRKGTLRMNLVVGHHEGECRPDTKISQKADEDHYHNADGDRMLRIQGFPHCEVGGSIGSG